MTRTAAAALLGLLLACPAWGQGDIQTGTIKKVDPDKNRITLTVDGKDQEFGVVDDTRFMGDAGELDQRLRSPLLKPNTPVRFKAQDNVLVGLKIEGQGDVRKGPAQPPGNIRRAKVKKLDLDGKTITLTSDGKDETFTLTDETLTPQVEGKNLAERLRGIKDGSDVQFIGVMRDGRRVLFGIRLAEGGAGNAPPPPNFDSSKLKPLTELGTGEYQGFQGGLYPGGKNERPQAHEQAGLALAKEVQPRDTEGKPSPAGKIVILSVGMSNTSQASQGFEKALRGDSDHNSAVVFVNGAQGGMTAARIKNPGDNGSGSKYWGEVDVRLKTAGLSREQVQVAWIKQADAGPNQGFPGYAQQLEAELTELVQALRPRFPNLKQVYLSSRTFGGYAKTRLNPEPYAYESGFAVRWLVERQLKGDPELRFTGSDAKAPWLSWGPYLWANGSTKRAADGFSYDAADFVGDGTHLSGSGVDKVGRLMLDFFKTDSTTRPWFTRR